MPVKKKPSKKRTDSPVEDEQIVRFSLELEEGPERDLFIAVKKATRVTSNADIVRMILVPGLQSILEKFQPSNTSS